MDSKAVFTQESHKEVFMGLCINVLPLIGEIIDSAKKSGVDGMVGLTVDTNGYISFDVHNSRWGMKRLDSDSPAKIEYRFSEVVDVPEVKAGDKAVFGHLTENIMEITLVYADLQISNPELCKIESSTRLISCHASAFLPVPAPYRMLPFLPPAFLPFLPRLQAQGAFLLPLP